MYTKKLIALPSPANTSGHFFMKPFIFVVGDLTLGPEDQHLIQQIEAPPL
jgi:hypothetical protein